MEQICFDEKISCRLLIFLFNSVQSYNEAPIQGGNCGCLTFYDDEAKKKGTIQQDNCKARLVGMA
jgi:hypothetical protein